MLPSYERESVFHVAYTISKDNFKQVFEATNELTTIVTAQESRRNNGHGALIPRLHETTLWTDTTGEVIFENNVRFPA